MNNVVLIIGASSDIGINIIKKIDEKCLIIAHYNSSDEKLLELTKVLSNEMVMIQADLSSENEIFPEFSRPYLLLSAALERWPLR